MYSGLVAWPPLFSSLAYLRRRASKGGQRLLMDEDNQDGLLLLLLSARFELPLPTTAGSLLDETKLLLLRLLLLSQRGLYMTLCWRRVTDSDRSGSTLGSASSQSVDSVDGQSSSIDLTLDEPLESWLDRLENKRENSLRVELRPSVSGRLVGVSGAGRGGSEVSDLEELYHL